MDDLLLELLNNTQDKEKLIRKYLMKSKLSTKRISEELGIKEQEVITVLNDL